MTAWSSPPCASTTPRSARPTRQCTSPNDSYAAGRAIAAQLKQPSLRGVLVLSDGLNVNGSELVKGLNDTLGEAVVVTGGLAGDGTHFKRTWVLKDRTPQSGYVTAVGFYGDHIRLGHGSKGGWDKFGPERQVTKSHGNVLYELDGRPALQLYKEYLGDRAAGLPATGLLFPLAIRTSPSEGKVLVRTILAVDEATQSMTFAGDIPEGVFAQLMRANFDRLIQGASEAADAHDQSPRRFARRHRPPSPSPSVVSADDWCLGNGQKRKSKPRWRFCRKAAAKSASTPMAKSLPTRAAPAIFTTKP